jgi:hypothetical protein
MIEKTVRWARKIQIWRAPWVTGIYPNEMAAFLGACDALQIRTIVECGRGLHGYSTQVLSEYGLSTGTKIVSIDYAPPEASVGPVHIHKHVRFLTGDAFKVLPKAFKETWGPYALLVDGPKHHAANRLSLAAVNVWPIQLVAHHNAARGASWSEEFRSVFIERWYHDALVKLANNPHWQNFRAWERMWTNGGDVGDRTLANSSLVLATTRVVANHPLIRGPLSQHPTWLKLKWRLS